MFAFKMLHTRFQWARHLYVPIFALEQAWSPYYAIYFEYYMPQVNLRFAANPLDVVLYFSGALFFLPSGWKNEVDTLKFGLVFKIRVE